MLVDGQDIRDFTLESLRRNVGIVQQDVFIFGATIRDNIGYGAAGRHDGRRGQGGKGRPTP